MALVAVALVTSACATGGSQGWRKNKNACMVVGGLLGGAAGALAANARHTDDDTQDIAVGAGVGAAAGALLGRLLCAAPQEGQSPTASASGRPTSGTAPLAVDFRGSGADADGRIVAYEWDLGDGTRSTDRNVRHVYESPGSYTARLTVTDNDGLRGSDRVGVTVSAARAAPPEPPRVEKRIILRGLNFEFDSARIRPEGEVILDEAVRVLTESRDVRVEIAGHTDSTGPEAYNQGLSQRRARAVRDSLVSNGADPSSITVNGYGESQPVADNGTREGRAQNRRVELNVLR